MFSLKLITMALPNADLELEGYKSLQRFQNTSEKNFMNHKLI